MIYEYTCKVCNVEVSVECSIHDTPDIPMHCGELTTKKFYAPPVKFNATGFYSTGNQSMIQLSYDNIT